MFSSILVSPDVIDFVFRNEDSNDPDFMSPKNKRRKRASPREDDYENSDDDFDNFKDGDDDRESTGLIGSPFSTASSIVAGEGTQVTFESTVELAHIEHGI